MLLEATIALGEVGLVVVVVEWVQVQCFRGRWLPATPHCLALGIHQVDAVKSGVPNRFVGADHPEWYLVVISLLRRRDHSPTVLRARRVLLGAGFPIV